MKNNYNSPYYNQYIGSQGPAPGDIIREDKYPFIVSLRRAALLNTLPWDNFWTGKSLQLNVMSIGPGRSTEMKMSPEDDEFIYVLQGRGIIGVGSDRANIRYFVDFTDDNAIIIPAGMWYTITNNSVIPIKIYILNSLSKNFTGDKTTPAQ